MARHWPGWQWACNTALYLGIMTALSVRMSSVNPIQPTRAMSSQRPCRCGSDPLRLPARSAVIVRLCCRFIDAPGSCLRENCLHMQALLSYVTYYHMCVLKSLRATLRPSGARFPPTGTLSEREISSHEQNGDKSA